MLRGLGRGRAVELQDLEYRSSVLNPEGLRHADSRHHVPVLAAHLEIQAGTRMASRGPRQDFCVRAQGRISDRLRSSGAAGTRRAAAGVRSVETAVTRRGLV